MKYLAMKPLTFCGLTFKQNDYIEVSDQPSAAEKSELERLNRAVALRAIEPKAPLPGAKRDTAMEPAAAPQTRGYKTRAGAGK